MMMDIKLDVADIVIDEDDIMSDDYRDVAQERIEEIRAFRERIPKFAIPPHQHARRALVRAASLPPEFLAGIAMVMKSHPELVHGGAVGPDEIRDLIAYADAFDPVANEIEALAHFLRYSVAAARNKAGSVALSIYALARVLAKRPEHADLIPLVEDMRRNLRAKRKRKAAEPPPEETPSSDGE